MEEIVAKKNGLLYTPDFKTIVGIDSSSNEFTGKVPAGAKRIEEEAFSCCDLTFIDLPDSVTEIGANAFGNSPNLERVHLPVHLDEFPPYMFYCCKALKEIPFRGGIKVLPECVAYGCSSVTTIVLPSSVEKICANAFSNCQNLRAIVLSSDLKEVEPGIVVDCPNLSHIRIPEDNENFRTNDDCTVLYKVNPDGTETAVFEVPKRAKVNMPGFNELAEDENPSIIDYDGCEDETEDDTMLFASEEEKNTINEGVAMDQDEIVKTEQEETVEISFNDEQLDSESAMDSLLSSILGQNKMYDVGDFSIEDIPEASEEEKESSVLASSSEDEDQSFESVDTEASQEAPDISFEEIPQDGEPALADESIIVEEPVVSDDTAVEETPSEEPVMEFASEEAPAQDTPLEEDAFDFPVENSVEDRLAEIMAQGQMFGDEVFSINDIPEASEQEIELSCLEPKNDDGMDLSEPTMKVTVGKAADEATMEERLSQIIAQDKEVSEFSIMDIPVASEEELAADRVLNSEEASPAAVVPDSLAEEPEFEPVEEMIASSENHMFMQNLAFESSKVLQKNTEVISTSKRNLYVFAESLVNSEIGETFSPALENLCNRLAKIHGFTTIYYFNGTRIDTDKFRSQLSDFMREKDVIYATKSDYVSMLPEEVLDFVACIGIAVDKESIENQVKNANMQTSNKLKLLVKDE